MQYHTNGDITAASEAVLGEVVAVPLRSRESTIQETELELQAEGKRHD
jgi:hypothetical protein